MVVSPVLQLSESVGDGDGEDGGGGDDMGVDVGVGEAWTTLISRVIPFPL
jgi:hypothetical protein